MSAPTSPDPVTSFGDDSLRPYVSNGLIGLRVMDLPLMPGVAIVSGLSGEHPVEQVESAARARTPSPAISALPGLREAPHRASLVDQHYDFGSGELLTGFAFSTDAVEAEVEILLFCSRTNPSIVAAGNVAARRRGDGRDLHGDPPDGEPLRMS